MLFVILKYNFLHLFYHLDFLAVQNSESLSTSGLVASQPATDHNRMLEGMGLDL